MRYLALTLGLLYATVSPAAMVTFFANLDGLQEVPPNASPATGFSTVLLDTDTNSITVNLEFQGLLGIQTAAHKAGPVRVPLPLGNFVGFAAVITDSVEAAMLAGNTYVNVHSNLFPGGEIRGQLQAIPEPSSFALAGLGFAAAMLLRRRIQ